ncbi:HEAT repeat domain-containing protein [Ideonella dechloratans]|uniref:HEAT repeat domain-containing protein n=1 Tax=Ideonella dechloratans TaxID=36863 RepID=UPI0035AF2806
MIDLAGLRERLASTSPRTRNIAAIELMDAGDSRAVPLLVEAIERPENRNARGTLIYALSDFDCSELCSQLVRWATEGGYEATGEALCIIRNQGLRPSASEVAACKAAVSAVRLGEPTEEQLELAAELDELLFGPAR